MSGGDERNKLPREAGRHKLGEYTRIYKKRQMYIILIWSKKYPEGIKTSRQKKK